MGLTFYFVASEPVQNFSYTIEYGETIEYEPELTITFERPCHTYGTFSGYNVGLLGIRDGREPHEIIEKINQTTFTSIDIKPEYSYTIGVSVLTEDDYESQSINVTFVSQAGGNPFFIFIQILHYYIL